MFNYRLNAIALCCLFIFLMQNLAFAQLKRVTTPNMISKPAIYLNSKGKRYSTLITFKFKKDIINLPKGIERASVTQITLPEVKHFLNTIRQKYGSFTIEKDIPSAVWGDTVRINKRTGKTVFIKDMSQYFRLRFSKLVPVDSIAQVLSHLPGIVYAQGPLPIILTASPNDPEYQNSTYRWAFNAINASRAWDITKGSPEIRISINGDFGSLGQIHEDLVNKVVYRYNSTASGGHGTEVAGIAGAETNNNLDVTSLGWKTSIMFNKLGSAGISSAVSHGADVINFSWVYTPPGAYEQDVKDEIHNALKQGVVCIASAANDSTTLDGEKPPKVVYPAAFNFGSDGQVIAVSATTDLDPDSTEKFIPNFNFSPGTDPINDPTDAFIDCSAPGGNMDVLNPDGTTGTSYVWEGTSYSTPFVSALVSLILSLNNKLTTPQIYNIITKTTDKIGSYTYDANGWNQYFGYGRINAYEALKYTLEHYGGTLTQNITVPQGDTWTFNPGAVIKLDPNVEIIVKPGAKIIAGGTQQNPIHFEQASSGQEWNTIALQGNDNQFTWTLFDGGYEDVDVESAGNDFSDCTFRNGWRGISSYWDQAGDGGESAFYLYNCMVEHNSTVGAVVYNANAGLSYTTIQDNGQAGIYFDNGTGDAISNNAFINNDTTYETGRGGLEVVAGSDVSLMSEDNEIADNPKYQVKADASSSLVMGESGVPEPGYNSVYRAAGNGNYVVYNQNSNTLDAYGNWWGTSSPYAGMFYGSVNYSDPLSFNPCAYDGCGVQPGQYPDKISPAGSKPVLVLSRSASTDPQTKTTASTPATQISAQTWKEKRRTRMHTLWSQIARSPDARSLLSEMEELYTLHLVSRGDTSFSSERKQDRALWDGIIRNYMNGTQDQNPGRVHFSATQIQPLMIMDEHEAQRFRRYGEARKKAALYASYITSPREKIALETDQMNLLDQQGQDQQALAMLDTMEQGEVGLGESRAQVDSLYSITRQELKYGLRLQTSGAAGTSSRTSASMTVKDSTASTQPAVTALKPNYPNPFNPTTIIRYELARAMSVHLTVYNVLGQKVAVLVNSRQQAGWHQAVFNALNLSSGLYFYRLQAGNKILVKKMLLLK